MSDYHIDGSNVVTGTPGDSAVSIEVASSTRIRIFDFTTGFQLASPSDNLLNVQAGRTTADGTGDARTPNPMDPADAASSATGLKNHSAEPTYTANEEVWGPMGLHMRATYRWVAVPGREIVCAGSANVGVGFVAFHASVTPEHFVSMHFSE